MTYAFRNNDWDKTATFKISLETNSFAKGVRDLYRVIAPIAYRKVTVSPRIIPRKYFCNKIFFAKNIFWTGCIRGAYLKEGVCFSRNQKYCQDHCFIFLDAAHYA